MNRDEAEQASFRFFLFCDGKTKKNIWLTKLVSDVATINYRRGEKKRKDRVEKEREEENCVENQQTVQNYGYCCHQHAKMAKKEDNKYKQQMKRQTEKVKQLIDRPEHCIHCDEDPCVFLQIEMRLCENDNIYYDQTDYEKGPVAYNSVLDPNVLSSMLHSFYGKA
jgi:hypothetical protein